MEEPRYCDYSSDEALSQMADEITEPKKVHDTSLNKKGNTFQQVGLSIGIGNRLATVWEKFRRTFECALKMLFYEGLHGISTESGNYRGTRSSLIISTPASKNGRHSGSPGGVQELQRPDSLVPRFYSPEFDDKRPATLDGLGYRRTGAAVTVVPRSTIIQTGTEWVRCRSCVD